MVAARFSCFGVSQSDMSDCGVLERVHAPRGRAHSRKIRGIIHMEGIDWKAVFYDAKCRNVRYADPPERKNFGALQAITSY
jgi:hypothetical protein